MKFISHAMTFIIPLLPALLVDFSGLSSTQTSLLLAFIFFVSGSLQIFVGHFFDQGYGKAALYVSFGCAFLGILLLMLYPKHLALIALGAILTIISLDILSTAILRCLVASAPEHIRAEATTRLYFLHNLGLCMASILAFYFLKSHRILLYLGDMITTLSMIALLIFLFNSLNFSKKNVLRKNFLTTLDKQWWKTNWRNILYQYLMYINVFVHALIIPILYNKSGLDAVKWTTFLLAVNTFTVAVFAMPIVRLFKKMRESHVILISCLLFALSHMMVPYFLNPWGIALTTFIGVLGEISCVGPSTNLLYRCFKTENLGLASGLKVSLRAISMFTVPLLGLVLFSCFKDFKLGFALMFAAIPILTFLVIKPTFNKVLG